MAIIDDEDYERVIAAGPWHADIHRKPDGSIRNVYARSHGPKKVRLQRFLLGVTDASILVDHRDHDGLNNQKSNLRIASKPKNGQNARKRANTDSQFKGVYLDKRRDQWIPRVQLNGKYIYLGQFKTEIEAAAIYNWAARKFFGDFACPNDFSCVA